ncbi:hypothetical protein IscW_ISCW000134, partial [Ixodes scapularis]
QVVCAEEEGESQHGGESQPVIRQYMLPDGQIVSAYEDAEGSLVQLATPEEETTTALGNVVIVHNPDGTTTLQARSQRRKHPHRDCPSPVGDGPIGHGGSNTRGSNGGDGVIGRRSEDCDRTGNSDGVNPGTVYRRIGLAFAHAQTCRDVRTRASVNQVLRRGSKLRAAAPSRRKFDDGAFVCSRLCSDCVHAVPFADCSLPLFLPPRCTFVCTVVFLSRRKFDWFFVYLLSAPYFRNTASVRGRHGGEAALVMNAAATRLYIFWCLTSA